MRFRWIGEVTNARCEEILKATVRFPHLMTCMVASPGWVKGGVGVIEVVGYWMCRPDGALPDALFTGVYQEAENDLRGGWAAVREVLERKPSALLWFHPAVVGAVNGVRLREAGIDVEAVVSKDGAAGTVH